MLTRSRSSQARQVGERQQALPARLPRPWHPPGITWLLEEGGVTRTGLSLATPANAVTARWRSCLPKPLALPTPHPLSCPARMGNASSLQALEQLSGTEQLGLEDHAWQQLFSYSTPLSRFDPAEVEAQVKPQTANLGACMLDGWAVGGR